MRDGLREVGDFDEYDVINMRKQTIEWNKLKEKESNKALLETYTQRLKDQQRSDFKKF